MAAGAEDRESAHQVVSRVTTYGKAIERYRHRHCGKAGIPGWAQVNGLRGETDTLEKGSAKLAYDFYYMVRFRFGSVQVIFAGQCILILV